MKMNRSRKLEEFICFLLIVMFSNSSPGLAIEGGLDSKAKQLIGFADSIFECGVYYQYTAGGLKNNPNVPRETVQFVSGNSASLLQTADDLYQTVGISTRVKYDELMLRAKTMLREQNNDQGTGSDVIYEFGEKCRLLLASYPAKLRAISDLLEAQ